MNAPQRFAEYLIKEPYHPRSNKHSNALLEFLLADLLEFCPRFKDDASARRICYDLNKKVRVATSEWNVDLVVGPPAAALSSSKDPILRTQPTNFWIAAEAKSIMTEHRKAQRNRQRDLDALHQFMHRYDQNTVVASITVVNISEYFRSPLRRALTKHRDSAGLVRGSIELLRTLPLRSHPSNGPGLEANTVIVVNYNNSKRIPVCCVHAGGPAPQPGDPMHWDSFVRRICDLYGQRWTRT